MIHSFGTPACGPLSRRGRQAPSARVRHTILASASVAPKSGSQEDKAQFSQEHHSVEWVKNVLKKEHEHHDQGKVMLAHTEGRGRRMTVGYAIRHVPNLSGEAERSVDYSLFG